MLVQQQEEMAAALERKRRVQTAENKRRNEWSEEWC